MAGRESFHRTGNAEVVNGRPYLCERTASQSPQAKVTATLEVQDERCSHASTLAVSHGDVRGGRGLARRPPGGRGELWRPACQAGSEPGTVRQPAGPSGSGAPRPQGRKQRTGERIWSNPGMSCGASVVGLTPSAPSLV